jgi:low affinity Fe/Cu permease
VRFQSLQNGKMADVGIFCRCANYSSRCLGGATAFGSAIGIVILWAITGPLFHYSDSWQLIINTGTTIVTFLMVFLIQNSQNRDNAAIQLKLDEIIRSTHGAHNAMLDLERLSTNDLEKIQALYQQLAEKARSAQADIHATTGTPHVSVS